MQEYWIKLYIELVDDSKVATMPDRLWRRMIELFLLAGRYHQDGGLPDTKQLAWTLRLPPDDLEMDLRQLEMTGIIRRQGTGWFVVKFATRQARLTDAEKQKHYRERLHHKQYGVTPALPEVTQINRLTDNRLTDNRLTEAEEEHLPLPTLPVYDDGDALEAQDVFTQVTGMMTFPAKERDNAIEALRIILRNKGGKEPTIKYLKPYFDEWTSRKRADGQDYLRTNLAWLTDWAVTGHIPSKSNGKQPAASTGDQVRALRKQLEAAHG